MLARILGVTLFSVLITLVAALVLIFTQTPKEMSGEGGLDFSRTLAAGRDTPAPLQSVPMRDGYPLQVRTYGGADDVPLLVLIHGSGWHGLQFDALGAALQGSADVIVPDLRGHGTAPGRRGDVDYIGQFEDDLADLINAVAKPGQKVIMGGHSSGGGLVVRFAGGEHGKMLDGAVLLAPFLKYNAPTTRTDSGGWAYALTRRIIGLSVLNTFKITALNDLPILQFNMPQAVLDGPLGDTATLAYSYRLNASYAPRSDYLADVAALPPFVLLAGGADEAFFAQKYAPTMGAVTDKGRFDLMTGATHLGIVDDPRTKAIIKGFLDDY
ncbi:pimeloyl-ACP methyl ester carboxylesterase [Sulfitobacter undariae]|uniref:Pimeloyl-ACP methyl ester carboxylesterase n=1 Tax=Sulfitobacter undariae TaxID=1563671 RepID=A0A7W6E9N5_9RHOB|nr:alpha/beta fold hydrolase [Sulfitobacter undariae]MBB3993854.1 pimeloyl-ACP methyl ester carboxylesterase [Sulfitobacter undariae]